MKSEQHLLTLSNIVLPLLGRMSGEEHVPCFSKGKVFILSKSMHKSSGFFVVVFHNFISQEEQYIQRQYMIGKLNKYFCIC